MSKGVLSALNRYDRYMAPEKGDFRIVCEAAGWFPTGTSGPPGFVSLDFVETTTALVRSHRERERPYGALEADCSVSRRASAKNSVLIEASPRGFVFGQPFRNTWRIHRFESGGSQVVWDSHTAISNPKFLAHDDALAWCEKRDGEYVLVRSGGESDAPLARLPWLDDPESVEIATVDLRLGLVLVVVDGKRLVAADLDGKLLAERRAPPQANQGFFIASDASRWAFCPTTLGARLTSVWWSETALTGTWREP